MDYVEVEIVGWHKYNNRRDIQSAKWFKLSNVWLEDSDFYGFTFPQKIAWIYILSQSSKRYSRFCRIHFDHAYRSCQLRRDVMEATLRKLNSLGIVKINEQNQYEIEKTVTDTLPRQEENRLDKNRIEKKNGIEDKASLSFETQNNAKAIKEMLEHSCKEIPR